MSGATFDAGILVALERDDRRAWAVLRRYVDQGEVPTIPTVVIGQAWRGGPRQARLARALAACRSEPVTDHVARRAGELCGRAGTSDIVDAIVVESASRRRDDVFTGDVSHLEHLAAHVSVAVAIVPLGA